MLNRIWPIFITFLKLGLTSFGGPVAHIGYFRHAFVEQRRWLSEHSYADLVALCQFMPGPASSQVGLAIGFLRGGYAGAIAAWLGFTLPSALVLCAVALGYQTYGALIPSGVLSGLKIVAVAVVAQAVWGMQKTLCQGPFRISIMIVSACAVLLIPGLWTQFSVLIIAAILGRFGLQPAAAQQDHTAHKSLSRRSGLLWLSLFVLSLLLLPLLAETSSSQTLSVADAFYRTGSFVFGGGHVVLPLLHSETVSTGWVSQDAFLVGYGVTQAVPGPLFTFAAFLGATMQQAPSGLAGAALCIIAIFLPSFLLVFAALPFWQRLRHNQHAKSALAGINAAVVGLLLAALYDPVFTSSIDSAKHMAFALLAGIALMAWRCPVWLLVVLAGVLGGVIL